MRKLCIAIFFLILTTQIYSQCCLRLDGRKCLQCPNGTHLFRGSCIMDVNFCATYKDGFDCDTCISGYQLNLKGDCDKVPVIPIASTPILSSAPTYTEVMIDPKNLQGSAGDIFSMTDDFLRGTNPQIATASVIGARLRTYRNNTVEVTIQYEVVKNTNYRAVMEVDADTLLMKQISFAKVTDLILAKSTSAAATSIAPSTSATAQTQSQPPASASTPTLTTPTATTPTPNSAMSISQPADTAYGAFNPAAPFDQFYSICKDVIGTQSTDYAGLEPTSTKKYVQGSITFYLLRFSKADGSVWDVYIRFDSDSYTAKVDRSSQVSPATKPVVSAYKKIDLAEIYLDINFIMVSEYINRQSNNKYKDAVIRSVDKMSNAPVDTYKVTYELGNRIWEVVASINTSTFATIGYSESQGDLISKSTAAVSTPSANTITNNPPSTPTSSTAATVSAAVTAPAASNQAGSSVKSGSSFQPSTSVTSLVNPNSLNIVSFSSSSSATSTPSPTSSTPATATPSNPSSSPPATSTVASSSTTLSTQPLSPTPPTSPPASSSGSNNSNNGNSNSNNNGNSNKLPPAIQQLSSGLSSLTRTDMQASEFRDIDNLIRSANAGELKSAMVVGAFVKVSSFTKNYQIYYMVENQEIYAAVVSRDQLRKRTYIISFGKLGY